MKISEFIANLEKSQSLYGDLEIRDAATNEEPVVYAFRENKEGELETWDCLFITARSRKSTL